MIPSTGRSKGPCITWKRHQTELPAVELIGEWTAKYNPERWGVVTGRLSGVVVADFDGNAGLALMEKWCLRPHVGTGSGGCHVYLQHPGWPVPTLNAKSAKQVWPWPGLDIRGDGGFAVLLGSNENGPYVQLRELDADPFVMLPAEVRDFLRSHGTKQDRPLAAKVTTRRADAGRVSSESLVRRALDMAGTSGRNNAGFWLAVQLRDNGYSSGEAEQELRNYRSRCTARNAKGKPEPYAESEMLASLAEAFSRPAREPWTPKHVGTGGDRPVMAPAVASADSGQSVEACSEAPGRLGGGDDWRLHLLRGRATKGGAGEPLAVLANAITAARRAPEMRGMLGWNEFSSKAEMLRAPIWGGQPGDWTDHEDRLYANWLHHNGIYVSVETAGQAAQAVARDCPFHPVRKKFDALKWDGTRRIESFCSLYLGTEPTDYAAAVGSAFLRSMVARIYEPGCKVDCCLILEGPQGIRKSTALRILGEPWFTDELAELGSKDAALQTRGVLLVEIAELDSMTRAEVGKIKAFMSRPIDRFRPPYGRHLLESPRQCVFAGSVNHSSYLRDATGGRRFWPVACGQIRTEELARDRDQLLAEAVVTYRAGKPWWLHTATLIRQAEDEQAQRFEDGPWDGLILAWAAERIAGGFKSISTAEVLDLCIKKPTGQWNRQDRMAIASALTRAGWERYRERTGAGLEWRYRPVVPTSGGNNGLGGNTAKD